MSLNDVFEDHISDIPLEKKYDQANHNLKVANYLFKTTKLKAYDWVLTISYYSVIHYFEFFIKKTSPILKLHGKEAKVSSVNEIIEKLCDNTRNKQKHLIRQKIVENNYSQIGASWKFLSKGCYNARYNCYLVSNESANKALKEMDQIKIFFDKKVDSRIPV